jgi:hypothetical protein
LTIRPRASSVKQPSEPRPEPQGPRPPLQRMPEGGVERPD